VHRPFSIQEHQLIADLHAKEAALTVAQVTCRIRKSHAPADGTVGERQVADGTTRVAGTQVLTFVSETKWIQANYREKQLTHMKVGDRRKSESKPIPDNASAARFSKSHPPAVRNSLAATRQRHRKSPKWL